MPEQIYDVVYDPPRSSETVNSKRRCYALIATVASSLVIVVLLSISLSVVIFHYHQENQALKQQVEELVSRPLLGITSQLPTNPQAPTTPSTAPTTELPMTTQGHIATVVPLANHSVTTSQPASQEMTTTETPTTSQPWTISQEHKTMPATTQVSTTSSPIIGSLENPASTCQDIPQDSSSGEYWIQASDTTSPVEVYCDTNRTSCSCATERRWMRVANLDMTDTNQRCPSGFRFVSRTRSPLRTCGRITNSGYGCSSTTFPVHGVAYSHVCGRVIAYQDGLVDAFREYASNPPQTIDSVFVDGVILTHGQSPRQHIWTFAAAQGEQNYHNTAGNCPCVLSDMAGETSVPPFIGQDYFCDTGNSQSTYNGFYSSDPLWDGQGCGFSSTCCEFNNPPWFCKQLPQSTTDDIELRVCANLRGEDTPLEIVEIYVH